MLRLLPFIHVTAERRLKYFLLCCTKIKQGVSTITPFGRLTVGVFAGLGRNRPVLQELQGHKSEFRARTLGYRDIVEILSIDP